MSHAPSFLKSCSECMGLYVISQQDKVALSQVLIVTIVVFIGKRWRRSGICIQHHYLVPPSVDISGQAFHSSAATPGDWQ